MATSWQEIFDLGDRETPAGEPAPEGEERRRGAFRRLRESLSKSRRALVEELSASLFDRIDNETWERLEEALILADVGAPTTAAVVERLEHEVEAGTVAADGPAVRERLIEILAEVASTAGQRINLKGEPAVLLMVGVNGTGKTTTIGKIAWHLSRELGLSVLLAAADTYRAAAAEQLTEWAERAGAEIVRSDRGRRPGRGRLRRDCRGPRARRGRCHRRHGRPPAHPGQPHGRAREGAPGDRQADARRPARDAHRRSTPPPARTAFARQSCLPRPSRSTASSSRSSTARPRAGSSLAIASELGIPVKLIGVGESLEDLRPFDARDFARALLSE